MDLAALGAFLSGVGAVLSTMYAFRRVRQRADEECEKRLDALREGLKLGRERE
jgi:hypothetical protein